MVFHLVAALRNYFIKKIICLHRFVTMVTRHTFWPTDIVNAQLLSKQQGSISLVQPQDFEHRTGVSVSL